MYLCVCCFFAALLYIRRIHSIRRCEGLGLRLYSCLSAYVLDMLVKKYICAVPRRQRHGSGTQAVIRKEKWRRVYFNLISTHLVKATALNSLLQLSHTTTTVQYPSGPSAYLLVATREGYTYPKNEKIEFEVVHTGEQREIYFLLWCHSFCLFLYLNSSTSLSYP